MPTYAATQIPKPVDEQAFERACVVLWMCLLKDPNVQQNGRRGQRQNGVDIFGLRDGDPSHLVGVQCKLKSDGQELSEDEINEEFRKALTFTPTLTEYFIVTTAPDHVRHHEFARTLSHDLGKQGRRMAFAVWGWNTLQTRIAQFVDAHKCRSCVERWAEENPPENGDESIALSGGPGPSRSE